MSDQPTPIFGGEREPSLPGPEPVGQGAPSQDAIDAGMGEAGRLPAIERRLIRVDRQLDEVAARQKTDSQQLIALTVATIAVLVAIYALSRSARALGAP